MAPPLLLAGALILGHLVAVLAALGTPERLPLLHLVAGLVASAVSVTGTVLATRAFSPGDHLRRAWGLIALSAVLLLLASAMRAGWMVLRPDAPFSSWALAPVRTGSIVALNLVKAVGLWLLVVTWRRSGLQAPLTLGWGVGLALGAAAALGITLPQFLRDMRDMVAHGGISAEGGLVNVSSTLGDIAIISLAVPLLRAALMLRGGRLAWPWWAMALSAASWLVFDAGGWLASVLPGDPGTNEALLSVFRTGGIVLAGASGLLQRAALEPAPAPAAPSLEVQRQPA